MKIKLGNLKKIIKDEVERNNRWLAGFFTGGGISQSNAGVVSPPPGLGDESEKEEELDKRYEKEQEKSQSAARTLKRSIKR